MQNPNQFSQSVEKGQLDLKYNGLVLSCIVASGETLVPGMGVKLKDVAGKGISIEALDADTDNAFGVVAYNTKEASYSGLDAVEIAAQGSVVQMEASAAIARGAQVMPVITGEKVATATSGKTVIGVALDKAAADGDLIRVLLSTDGSAKLAA